MDLLCLGELLIDFVPTVLGRKLRDVPAFEKAAGGAPGNVACGFSRLGGSSGFIGKVGNDEFGHFLEQTLQGCGVDTSYLYKSDEALTCLAFVSLKADGDRDFAFYRNPSADMLLRADEIPVEAVQAANIFHYGSITLIDEPVRSATLLGARAAGEAGRLVSFDPNLRPQLWPSLEQARAAILEGMRWAGMVKVSDEELAFITGMECGGGGVADAGGCGSAAAAAAGAEAVAASAANAAVQALLAQFPNLRMVALTSGPEGSALYTRNQVIRVPGFSVEAVDTTGAGDGFLAGLLFQMNRQMRGGESGGSLPFDWNQSDRFWAEAARFGNAIGAMVVTKRGGIPAMPEMSAVEKFLAECEV